MRIAVLCLSFFISLNAFAANITVHLVTEGAYFPWNFCYTANGEVNNNCTQTDLSNGQTLAGFDIDYGNALCAKMDEIDTNNTYTCTWTVRSWSDLSQGIGLGTDYDVVVAQMTATEERKAFADFLGPYMFTPEKKFISLVGTPVTMGGATKTTPRLDALGNTLLDCPTSTTLKVGVQIHTTHYNHANTYCLNPILTFDTQAEVDAALVNGTVDVMINLTSASKGLLEGQNPMAVAHGESLLYPGNGGPSIAFAKNNALATQLKPVVMDSIFSLFSTGFTRQLQNLWE